MPAGRPSSEDRAYAAELGLPLKAGMRKIKNLGGAEWLRSRPAEVRNILLGPLIPPHCPAPLPLEALLTEEDLQIEVPDLE